MFKFVLENIFGPTTKKLGEKLANQFNFNDDRQVTLKQIESAVLHLSQIRNDHESWRSQCFEIINEVENNDLGKIFYDLSVLGPRVTQNALLSRASLVELNRLPSSRSMVRSSLKRLGIFRTFNCEYALYPIIFVGNLIYLSDFATTFPEYVEFFRKQFQPTQDSWGLARKLFEAFGVPSVFLYIFGYFFGRWIILIKNDFADTVFKKYVIPQILMNLNKKKG